MPRPKGVLEKHMIKTHPPELIFVTKEAIALLAVFYPAAEGDPVYPVIFLATKNLRAFFALFANFAVYYSTTPLRIQARYSTSSV